MSIPNTFQDNLTIYSFTKDLHIQRKKALLQHKLHKVTKVTYTEKGGKGIRLKIWKFI